LSSSSAAAASAQIRAHVASAAPEALKDWLDALVSSVEEEFDEAFTEWLCAVDHWCVHIANGNTVSIASIAMNMVNHIDAAADVNGGDAFDVEDVLALPAVRAEWERLSRIPAAASAKS
jgi:hypothetical protein